MYKFERLNVEMIPIEQIEDEHDSEKDFHESFWWNDAFDRVKWEQITRPALFRNTHKNTIK